MAFFLAVVLAVAASFYAVASLTVPILLALWFAHLARPLQERLSKALGGRERAAAVVTALMVLAVIAPFALFVTALVPGARTLYEQIRGAGGVKGALEALVSGNGGGAGAKQTVQQFVEGGGPVAFLKEHGASAAGAVGIVLSASVDALVAILVFFIVVNAVLAEGKPWLKWAETHTPLPEGVFTRLTKAFHQAGRGLILGTGMTALIQGALATVIYAAFGVPRALLLGLLTVVAALIPMLGPPLVWIPIAAGLLVTGHAGKAGILSLLCLFVVGTIDNVLRPWLSKRADIGLPSALVLASMLGGFAAFGPWGILIGPLVLRLARELLDIARERQWLTR